MIQNPNDATVNIDVYCYDDSGSLLNHDTRTIPAHGRIAAYARDFNSGTMFFGSIVVDSDVPLAGVGMSTNNADTITNVYIGI